MLDSSHEVIELRKTDWDQLPHGLAHVETGQIPGYPLPTGRVILDPPELRSLPVYTVAVYARVSGRENKKQLDT